MPSIPSQDRRRTAAEVNEEIRALWLRTGGKLSPEQQAQYQLLVTEWADSELSSRAA